MRSLILVILSALLLAGLFVGYWMAQPAPHGGGVESTKNQPEVTWPTNKDPNRLGAIRPGQVVSVKKYDDRGELISEFNGDRFIPRKDGTIDVINPVARFFLANHQHIEITGKTGNVIIKDAPDPGKSGFTNMAPPSPPSRGRLNQVNVTLVDETRGQPLMTMTTNNVVFDNETYRITTEGYKEGEQEIAWDQVPVHVTGQIKMDGRGLAVRWNDKDGRLELLEIEHGDVLEITDPSGFSVNGSKQSAGTAVGMNSPGGPLPEMLAAADRESAAHVMTHLPPLTQKAEPDHPGHASGPPVVYQASFYDGVRINQPAADGKGDQILIENLERMDVDFLLKQGGSSTTRPTSTSAPSAASASVAEGVAPDAPATRPTAPPATRASKDKEPPVFVHWTGVLRITPVKGTPLAPLKPGDSAVLLTGAPAKVHRVEPREQGREEVQCASILYQTAGEKVSLGKSGQYPQIVVDKFPARSAKQQAPTHLVSDGTVQYSRGAEQKATLTGPGAADMPLDPEAKDPHPVLHAVWSKLAEFDFAQPPGAKQASVRLGHMEGDVSIKHPRVALKSQALDLLFEPPEQSPATKGGKSSEANLRQIIATTGVWCEVDGSDAKKQTIEADRLALDTGKSAGKLFARHLNATGSVHAYGEDDLRAGYVDLLLKPSDKDKPKPKTADDTAQVELEKMVARENVVAKSKDGSVASGDNLLVTTENGHQHTVLTSATQATVIDIKGNIVKGPEIRFDSAQGKAHIVGAGSMHAIQQASATQPAQPVDVTWLKEAIIDGPANRIDVDGSVVAKSIDKKGFVDLSSADHLRIDLRTKPTTQPAEDRAVASGSPTTRPGGMKMDPFKGKEPVAMTLQDNAALTSTLSSQTGDILQQFELKGPTIIVREVAEDGSRSRSLHVPAAGTMLVRDHRPPAKEKDPSGDSNGARGATAFQWHNDLLYGEATHRADMTGDVLVVHREDDPASPPVRMNCEHVIAFFEDAPKRKAGEKKASDDQAPLQLSYLKSFAPEGGSVTVVRDTDQIIAREIDFDPKRKLLIAIGTEQNPVHFLTGSTAGGTADRVEWDTVTWKMKTTNAVLNYSPATPGIQSPPGKKKPATRSSK